jgi:hypothetical protein
MRRLIAGVVLVAMLMLFVAVVTRTSEKRAEGRKTTMAFVVAVECPCGGGCEAHARTASDYEPAFAEAEGSVLKLPSRHVVSQRSDNEWNSSTVTNSGLKTGYVNNSTLRSEPWSGHVLKLPHYDSDEGMKGTTIHGASEALTQKGHFSVGVL